MNDTTSDNDAHATESSAEEAHANEAHASEQPGTAGDTQAKEAGEGPGEGPGAEAQQEAPPPEPTPEERLATAKAETKAMKEKMLRIAADFENYRRRSSKEVDDAHARGRQNTVKELLPVFDNLERATGHADENTDAKSIIDGLRMVHRQFLDVLGKLGVTRVDAVGQGFDPNVHESIQYEHSDTFEAGIVMAELQPGYRHNEMLIRPALVVVSRGPAPAAEAAPEGAAETEATGETASEPSGADPEEQAGAEDEGDQAR